MVFQDPTGALNPRHTVYEAVAEGIRIHGSPARSASSSPRHSAGPGCGRRAVRRPLPARDLRRPAPARADRRGDRPVAAAAARRRAGGLARRVDPRRDPRRCCARSSTSGAVDRRRHPRPRAGVEHRRPHRRDVPRPDRRARHDRGGARSRRSTRTPRRCCRWCRRREHVEPADPHRRDPRPQRDPAGCRFHPRCPLVAVRRGRARSASSIAAPDARRRARRPGRRPPRRLPRRCHGVRSPTDGVRGGPSRPPEHPSVDRSRVAGDALPPSVGAANSVAVDGDDELDRDVVAPRSSERTVSVASVPTRRLRPARSDSVAEPSAQASAGFDRRHADGALVVVVDRLRRARRRSGPAVAGHRLGLAAEHVVLDAPHDAVGLDRRPGRYPGANGCVDAGRPSTTGRRHGSTLAASTSERHRARRRPAVRPVGPGDRQPQRVAGLERPRRRLQLDGRRRSTRRGRAAPGWRRPRPSASAGQHPRWREVEHAAGDQRRRAVGEHVAELDADVAVAPVAADPHRDGAVADAPRRRASIGQS